MVVFEVSVTDYVKIIINLVINFMILLVLKWVWDVSVMDFNNMNCDLNKFLRATLKGFVQKKYRRKKR